MVGPLQETQPLQKSKAKEAGLSFGSTSSRGEKSKGKTHLALFGRRRGLIPTTRMKDGLARDASGHPFEKSTLLWGCNFKFVIAGALAGVALFGSKDIAEPVAFVGVGFIQEIQEHMVEVVPSGGREITATLAIQEAEVGV